MTDTTPGWAARELGYAPIGEILHLVARAFGCQPADLLAKGRQVGAVTRARMVVSYVARRTTALSYPQLGRELHRDHSTIMAGRREVERHMARDGRFRAVVERIVDEVEMVRAPFEEVEPDPFGRQDGDPCNSGIPG